MRHGVKKVKVHSGKDANKALVRKFVKSFVLHGKLTTTLKRAKMMKSIIDEMTFKAVNARESDKVKLTSQIGDVPTVKMLLKAAEGFVGTGKTGGFVSIKKLGVRMGDFAEQGKLEWIGMNVQPAEDVKVEKAPEAKKVTPKAKPATKMYDKVAAKAKPVKMTTVTKKAAKQLAK